MSQPVNFGKLSQHESAEKSPGFLLWSVSTLWRRKIEEVLKPLGLTHPQFVILATTGWLTRTGQSVTQTEVGRYAALDPNTTSQILRSLEAKGWIQRTHRCDERSKSPCLTEIGTTLLNKALPAVEQADAHFFAPLQNSQDGMLSNLKLLAHLNTGEKT
ncbi:MAG: MarR family transcriptional regulator [Verrucomicrobia bacterium]|nr:MarR family transcriptional regulator [Verrucomicrobiota bacterium]MBS0645761.1 MarR family transcriptional regulator [Verrucomicrobiota bacterium]